MDDYDANTCLNAFGKFCDEVERNELTSSEEYQYWMFERGYLAAMQEVAKVIKLRDAVKSIDFNLLITSNSAAYH